MDDSQAVTGPAEQGRLGQPKLRLWGAQQPPQLIITIILNFASRQKETF